MVVYGGNHRFQRVLRGVVGLFSLIVMASCRTQVERVLVSLVFT